MSQLVVAPPSTAGDRHPVTLVGAEGALGQRPFEEAYDQILDITARELGSPVVLITPFNLSTDHTGGSLESKVLGLLPEYIAVVEAMSRKHGTRLLKVQNVFQEQLGYRDPSDFAPEPVTPEKAGVWLSPTALMELLASWPATTTTDATAEIVE